MGMMAGGAEVATAAGGNVTDGDAAGGVPAEGTVTTGIDADGTVTTGGTVTVVGAGSAVPKSAVTSPGPPTVGLTAGGGNEIVDGEAAPKHVMHPVKFAP